MPAVPTLTTTLTNDTTPVLTGTAEIGSIVTVVVGSATYSVTANGSGVWSLDTGAEIPTSGTFSLGADASKPVSLISTDAAGNLNNGSGTFTLDTLLPTLSSSTPLDNATGIFNSDNLVLSFSEAVTAGSGNIVISDGAGDVRTIAVGDTSQVTVSGSTVTINPSADLLLGHAYVVQIASGALLDAAGNAYAGISDNTTLNFTVTPYLPVSLSSIAAGVGGFSIDGEGASDQSGWSVSNAGDVNGDGLADLLIGARAADPASGSNAGRSYVVFGKTDLAAVNLSAIVAGVGGFVINGQAADDSSGTVVSSAGDVNGDGLSDVIIGADASDPSAGASAGRSYVVFGRTDTTAIELSALGTSGCNIDGISAADQLGISVSSAGDVNGDGYADVVVGAMSADPGGRTNAGSSYVIFGGSSVTSVDLNNIVAGVGGLVIEGQVSTDLSGSSVSSAGDVNGDGYDDLIIAAQRADTNGGVDAGRSYVVFGTSLTTPIQLSSVTGGTGGFVINGESDDERSGIPVSAAGDINGDGLADLAVGGFNTTSSMGTNSQGHGYVIFGKANNTTAVELSDIAAGIGGFLIDGQSSGDWSSFSISHAGDVNGDGLADLIVGAYVGDPAGGSAAGRSYVVYGKNDNAVVQLSAIDAGVGGFSLNGASASDNSGRSVSAAGDVNGDGLADLLVGAPNSDPAAGTNAGRSYVIFGATSGAFHQTAVDQLGTSSTDTLTDGGVAQTIVAGAGNDAIAASAASVLYGGAGNDSFTIDATVITALESPLGSGGNTGQLARIDGGSGIDTLVLAGSGLSLNLRLIADPAGGTPDGGNRLESIEHIDLTGSGANSLNLGSLDIANLSGTNLYNGGNGWGAAGGTSRHQLLVDGDSDDNLFAGGTWLDVGTATNGGQSYHIYNELDSNVQLLVDTDITGNLTVDALPALSSSTPAAAASNVAVGANLVLTFSETVHAGSGDIVIDNGAGDVHTIAVGDTSQVSFSGSTVTINPTTDLLPGGSYYVHIGSSAILDAVGQPYAGISDNTSLAFTTQAYAPIQLSNIAAGTGGYVIDGLSAEQAGYIVSAAGDVNGDGFDDVIIGTLGTGNCYVVFGQTDNTAVDLCLVAAGVGGFLISGLASDRAGDAVSGAGDVNGDGYADLIVGAAQGDPSGGTDAGQSYVVFGKTTGTQVDLSNIAAGTGGGFAINGEAAGGRSGHSVSGAGDVNGDGLADLVVGAPDGGANGIAYVVYGQTASTAVELSDVTAGTGGFTINGQAASGQTGYSVSDAGDVNGDGRADVIIGGDLAGMSGEAYVVYGRAGGAVVELSDIEMGNGGSGGFVIHGEGAGTQAGYSVSSAGDVNGDGLADLVIGAPSTGTSGDPEGRVYVVYGNATGANVDLANLGAAGFVFNESVSHSATGYSVSSAGDINGDGLSDLLIGATSAHGDLGSTYVVYGQLASNTIEATDVAAGNGGFVIYGEAQTGNASGSSVSAAGDINGDGLADLIVGAPAFDGMGGADAGRSYVIFGSGASVGAFHQSVVSQVNGAGPGTLDDSGFQATLVAGEGDDTLTATAASVLYGGAGNDSFVINQTMVDALGDGGGQASNLDRMSRIDGGAGFDSIVLSSSSVTLNLSFIAKEALNSTDGANRIDSIEGIDLGGSGNTLSLKAADVLAITGFNNLAASGVGRHELVVDGDSSDTVNFTDGIGITDWTIGSTETIGGTIYDVWTSDITQAVVYVGQTVQVI